MVGIAFRRQDSGTAILETVQARGCRVFTPLISPVFYIPKDMLVIILYQLFVYDNNANNWEVRICLSMIITIILKSTSILKFFDITSVSII